MSEATSTAAAPAPTSNGAASLPATSDNFAAYVAQRAAASATTPATTPVAAPASNGAATAPAPAADSTQAQPTVAELLAAEPQAGAEGAPADADPVIEIGGERIEGITQSQLLAAVASGELPEALLEKLRIKTRVNGRELTVSMREAGNGYQRLTDYSRDKQAVAAREADVDRRMGALTEFFKGWDQSGGLEAGLSRMGLDHHVPAIVTKDWGSAEQPNPQAFMDSMRRLGHEKTFHMAAEMYGRQWAAEQQLPPELRQQLAMQRDQMWKAREAAEQSDRKARQLAWQQQQQQLLARQQQQESGPSAESVTQEIDALRDSAFGALKMQVTPVAQLYFKQNLVAIAQIDRRDRTNKSMAQVVAEAAQATAEQLGDDRGQSSSGATSSPAQQQVQQQVQQQQRPGLPTRAAAAPTTTAPALPRTGSSEELLQRIEMLRGARR